MATARPGNWNLGCASPFESFLAAPEMPRPISSFPGSGQSFSCPANLLCQLRRRFFPPDGIFFAASPQSFYLCKFLWTRVIYWLDLIRESARFALKSVVLAAFLRRVSPTQSHL